MILERNPTPLLQNQGAGIVAGEDTLTYMRTYDRTRRGREKGFAIKSDRRIYLDQQGNIVHTVDGEDGVNWMTSWDLVYYLLRANYDGLESEYCDVPPFASANDSVNNNTDGSDSAKALAHQKGRYLHGCTVLSVSDSSDDKNHVVLRYSQLDAATGKEEEHTLTADLVIGADGPSSTIRSLFCPTVERTMTGYVALRGTIPEDQLSKQTSTTLSEHFTFFHGPGTQILTYLIPGPSGTLAPGTRLLNFVWYTNFPIDSAEFEDLMTDAEGKRHRLTLPPGRMRTEVWTKQIAKAKAWFPPQFIEIVEKTKQPFAQAITDVIAPTNGFLNGKVLLVGDALAGFRPHTVASTSQAAFDAMVLADLTAGRIEKQDFLRQTMMFARLIQRRGVEMGQRSQYGVDVPLEDHIRDRDVASTPREKEVYPEWTKAGM